MDKTTIILPRKVDEKELYEIFLQLKAYFNFRNWFLNILKTGQIDDKPIQNQFYLIDSKWFQNWKDHVGYSEIREHCKMREKLEDSVYKDIKPIIQYYSVVYPLLPFDNKNIYNNGEINPLADFVIVNKEFINLIYQKYKGTIVNYIQSFPIKFFKEKLMIYLNEQNISIIFKAKDKIYWELIFYFEKENKGKKELIEAIGISDMNEFLIEKKKFDLYSNETIEIEESNCVIKIINKKLLLKQKS